MRLPKRKHHWGIRGHAPGKILKIGPSYFARGSGCDEYVCVCLSVCMSVCPQGSPKPHVRPLPGLPIFVHVMPMAVARSFSGVVAIRYILPVLWMTSCFFSIMGCIAV